MFCQEAIRSCRRRKVSQTELSRRKGGKKKGFGNMMKSILRGEDILVIRPGKPLTLIQYIRILPQWHIYTSDDTTSGRSCGECRFDAAYTNKLVSYVREAGML